MEIMDKNMSSDDSASGLIISSVQQNDNLQGKVVHLDSSIDEHLTSMRQPEDSPEEKPQSRWRQRNPENHLKEKNKRRKNAGRPYETSKGDFIPPRVMGNPCKCKKKCRSRLLGKELQLFHAFWDLGSYDKQNVYLSSRIHVEQVKRHYKSRTKDVAKPPRRNVSYKYSVNIMGRQIFICKIEFLSVHGLQFSAKRLEILSRKLRNGMLIPKSDGRGKHKKQKKVDDISLEMVREHINIIPKYVSHYSREVNPKKVYLDCDMTISGLYRKYLEWIEKKNRTIDNSDGVSRFEVSNNSEKLKDALGESRDDDSATENSEAISTDEQAELEKNGVTVSGNENLNTTDNHKEILDDNNNAPGENQDSDSSVAVLKVTETFIPVPTDKEVAAVENEDAVSNVEVLNPTKKFKAISEDKYRRIFCTEFHIGFKLPKSDTCKTCDAIHIKLVANKDDENLVAKLKTELKMHQDEAKLMEDDLKQTMKRAKTTMDIDVIIADLQQALTTPNLTVGEAFYLRKSLTYNFGIHNGKTEKGHMFPWTENVAKRGSDEIASCIWKYLQMNKPSADHLIVFSDNCGGQNKNWNIMAFWRQLVLDGVYKSIEHRFLIPGHTRLPCDRDFALIEKEKNRVVQVFSPDHWYKIMEDCKQINKFEVTVMKTEDFYTFEQLLHTITRKTITDAKKPLHFRDARCFLFKSECGRFMYVKHDIRDQFTSVKIEKNGLQWSTSNLKELVSKKYDGFISLTQKKIDDLRKLIPFIPTAHRSFYEQIFLKPGIENDENDVELL